MAQIINFILTKIFIMEYPR